MENFDFLQNNTLQNMLLVEILFMKVGQQQYTSIRGLPTFLSKISYKVSYA